MTDAEATGRSYRAVEIVYHAYLTGLILTTVTRRSFADAAELVFRTFRRQHLEKFLPGLAKLGHARADVYAASARNRAGGGLLSTQQAREFLASRR